MDTVGDDGEVELRVYGGQSMTAPLKRVLLRRPDEAFAVEDPEEWNYVSRPDLVTARREHEQLVGLLEAHGIEVLFHKEPCPGAADAIFVFDPVLMTNEGAIVLKMGKPQREGEEASLEATLKDLDVPIIGRLLGVARAEGGDMLWLDGETLVVGRGFRTNQEGISQLSSMLSSIGVKLLPVDLPYFQGPKACLHLLSLISLIDSRLAVVYRPLLPVSLWKELRERKFDLVDVPEGEFETMGPNVLTLEPGRCVALNDNRITCTLLEARGYEVLTYEGQELSLKAEGGPTCLTLPILRDS